jgi:myo-inositol-1(or 4)-monophosphatase
MEFIRCCEEMAEIVREGTADLIGNPAAGVVVGMGADGTPTKKIDQVAEDLIIEYLEAANLCGMLISEEVGKRRIGDCAGTIFLDPIDGTYNAEHGIPFYSLSIAYAEGGIIQKGYVRDLSHNESFYAVRGKGAFLNGKTIHVSATGHLKESAISVYGRKFNPEPVLGLGQKIRRWRLLGSSALELCYVGSGRLDGFVDLRHTLRVTDAVAGMLVCTEAGGAVTDANGESIDFPEEVTVGRCLVASNGMLHHKIIEYLRS